MGWIPVIEGEVEFYSIADDLTILHDRFFEFIFTIAPVTWMYVLVIIIGIVLFGLLLSVKRALKLAT